MFTVNFCWFQQLISLLIKQKDHLVSLEIPSTPPISDIQEVRLVAFFASGKNVTQHAERKNQQQKITTVAF